MTTIDRILKRTPRSPSYLHMHLSIDTEGRISIHLSKWEIHFVVELQWEEIWGRHFINLANRKNTVKV